MLTDQKKTHGMLARHCPYNMKIFLTSVSAQIFIWFWFFLGGVVAVLSIMWDLSFSTSKYGVLITGPSEKSLKHFLKQMMASKNMLPKPHFPNCSFLKKWNLHWKRNQKSFVLVHPCSGFASLWLWKQFLVHRNKSPRRRAHEISKEFLSASWLLSFPSSLLTSSPSFFST